MFDPRTQSSQTHDHSYDNIVLNNSSNKNTRWYSNDQEVVQFRSNHNHQEATGSDDSGVCSPPLWKNSPSPSASPSQPLLSRHVYTSLSPNSRVQAIARGQRELMEMVKNMPESSYELSLKDLVENHHKIENQEAPPQVERISNNNSKKLQQRGVSKKNSDKNMMRNGSFKNKGLFIKMVLPPFLFRSKRKSNFGGNTNGKVSPKPEVIKGGGGGGGGSGGGEKDWWKKKFTGSSDSDSSRTSINSGSTQSSGGSSSSRSYSGGGRKKKNAILTGCWPIFQSRRSKSTAE